MAVPAVDAIDCWRIDLACADPLRLQRAFELLSPHEIERAEQYRPGILRRRYILRTAEVRALLSRYIGVAPHLITFAYEAHGRPVLAMPQAGIHFNLSHRGDLALLAVASGGPVGIDIEQVRSLPDWRAVAENNFAAAEVKALLRLPVEVRAHGFFVTWTRREAYLKCLGTGLDHPREAFATGVSGRSPALRVAGGSQTGCVIVDLDPSPGYVGALVTRQAARSTRLYDAGAVPGEQE